MMWRSIVGALLALLLAPPVVASNIHVRVVLDTSRSMLRYDHARLATLSTLLLYDLARTNSTLGDSFVVIPFHSTHRWNNPADPPPAGAGRPIEGKYRDRAALASSLATLPYDADWTYFYPGLHQAIDDLEATSGGPSDVRLIVLVTDGMPEAPTRTEEERLLREELAPRMKSASIGLYILAFGPQAYPNRSFFEGLLQGERLGKAFFDQDGSRLLESMIQIFSRSFGYLQDTPRTLPAGFLDLAAGQAPADAAVVLFWKQARPPVLELRTPQGRAVNTADGVREGKERGASYQMAWVLSPGPGPHPIAAMAPGAMVAVLRPMPVELEVRSPGTGRRVTEVMGGEEAQLEVLVRPAGGGKGDPGEINLTYQTHGEWTGGEFTWDGPIQAPPAGQVKRSAEGRIHPILPKFPEPEEGENSYTGHLEVLAKRGAKIQASLSGPRAHRVEVYPWVAITPVPARGDAVPEGLAAVRALDRFERGCARFRLDLAGRLPAKPAVYSLRALLAASTPTRGSSLAGAFYTLDGLPLEIRGAAGQLSSQWTRGRLLEKEDLLGEHEVCIQVGKPKTGDATRPFELPVELALLKSPYDAFDVVKPFGFKVLIAPPSFIERWGARAALGLSLLGLLATFWYLRGRPDLPPDLQVAVGRAGSRTGLGPQPLGEASLAARLLGLVEERPVLSEAGGTRLGVLKPFREGLYRFRPARGVRRIETPEGRTPEMTGDWAALSVHRTYRLWMREEEILLRLEYP